MILIATGERSDTRGARAGSNPEVGRTASQQFDIGDTKADPFGVDGFWWPSTGCAALTRGYKNPTPFGVPEEYSLRQIVDKDTVVVNG